LDQKDVIAFDKGCYPGQEIIARLHFIGKVKKRMEVITLINDTDVKPGETKFLEELNQKVEFCSPLVKSPKGWQAQVIK
jgi:folate-binding Fe-S cluster repair protein YgfZ